MERMIGILKQLERCPGTELFAERLEKLHLRQLITGSLQEQHGNLHFEKVFCALDGRLLWWMEWKPQEHNAPDGWQR